MRLRPALAFRIVTLPVKTCRAETQEVDRVESSHDAFERGFIVMRALLAGLFLLGCSPRSSGEPAAPPVVAPPKSDAQAALQPAEPEVRAGRPLSLEADAYLVADFESGGLEHRLGGSWVTSFDSYNLGTTLSPSPLTLSEGGAAGSEHSLGITGHFGRNVEPWPFVDVRAPFESTDLSAASKIRFWARGNGKEYILAIVRESVTDFAHFRAEFVAEEEWTLVELDLDSFHQPDWGHQVPLDLRDATALSFQPSAKLNDEEYELFVDNIELLR